MASHSRRNFLTGGVAVAGLAVCSSLASAAEVATEGIGTMEALEAIMTRRSVRGYTKKQPTDEQVEILLRAAMAAPSAGNEQPWEFVIIREPATLGQVESINRFGAFVKNAPLAILTCVNTEREKYEGYGIVDVSCCTQNILLAAHAMGLGAVWTGIYPQMDRVEGFRSLLGIPEHVIPLALVPVGYPRVATRSEDRYDATRIHRERW